MNTQKERNNMITLIWILIITGIIVLLTKKSWMPWIGLIIVMFVVLTGLGMVCIVSVGTPKENFKPVYQTSTYTYDINLSKDEQQKAILIEKAGGKVNFIQYKSERQKGVNVFWTFPFKIERKEQIEWRVDVYKGE
jgi:hypothetical protein